MPYDVSIIVVNYRAKSLVRECIKSFTRSIFQCSYEIIVVDNGCDPGLSELLAERFPQVSYIGMRRNLGYSAGVNAGISAAAGTYLLVSNMDITALHGSVDTLYRFMEEHPDVGIAGPQLLNPDRSIQQSYYRYYSVLTPIYRRLAIGKWLPGRERHLNHFLMKDCDMAHTRDVDWLLGASLFVRSSCVERVGCMDSGRFFLYFEDTDWCKRFWDAGYRVCYVPDAKMIHLYGRDSAQKKGLFSLCEPATRIHVASGINYFFKHGLPLRTK